MRGTVSCLVVYSLSASSCACHCTVSSTFSVSRNGGFGCGRQTHPPGGHSGQAPHRPPHGPHAGPGGCVWVSAPHPWLSTAACSSLGIHTYMYMYIMHVEPVLALLCYYTSCCHSSPAYMSASLSVHVSFCGLSLAVALNVQSHDLPVEQH